MQIIQSEQESSDTSGKFGYKLLKLKPDGSTQWKKTYAGNLGSTIKSAIQTSDGGYILGGQSNSGMEWDKTDKSRGESDFWIALLFRRTLPLLFSQIRQLSFSPCKQLIGQK
jgi:hypothetical protein